MWKFNKENSLYNAYTCVLFLDVSLPSLNYCIRFSMWQMAKSNSFPGVEVYKGGIIRGPHSLWSRVKKSFRANSLADTDWISGIRSAAYENYLNLNKAIARCVSLVCFRLRETAEA